MLINHQTAGHGSPVVLLHSSVADLRMWDAQWPELTAAHQAVRVDFRGFGQTPVGTGPYRDADDVRDVLDSLEISRAAVVGSSYGGRVALEFAAAYPERVTRLVLLCPGYGGLAPTTAAAEFDATETALLETGLLDRAVEFNVETWVGPAADDTTRELVREMQANNFRVQLAQPDAGPQEPQIDAAGIEVPALVVSGSFDMDHFRAIAAHLVSVMPQARGLELPWAGHLPSLERPAEVTELLLETLR